MYSATFFNTKEKSNQAPLLIALPGLVGEAEPTRINSILEELSNSGIVGMRINYVEKEERNGNSFYRFDVDKTASDIGTAVQKAFQNLDLNLNRVGIISNSISAVPVTKYLVSNPNGLKFKCYASISPLLGWKFFGTKSQREIIESRRIDLPITGKEDAITRFVPNDLLPHLKQQNGLELARQYMKNGMMVMTIIGINDKKADPQSMADYHSLMGGVEENLVVLDAGHDVPNSNEYVVQFMKKHLLF